MREDQRLLHGAIDTHIHASPSLFPRVCDHIECARGAASVGMRGVVFKIHHGDTSGRIPIVREVMGDAIEIYGGVALNSPVGGFCLLYTSPSPRDGLLSRMPSSA